MNSSIEESMMRQALERFMSGIAPEAVGGRYGRFSATDDLEQPAPRCINYTMSKNSDERRIQFSFDEMVFNEFKERAGKLAHIIGASASYSALLCKLDFVNGKYQLRTHVILPHLSMDKVYEFMSYLDSIKNDPKDALDSKHQHDFLEAVTDLKRHDIKLAALFNAEHLYRKEYLFDRVCIYTPDDDFRVLAIAEGEKKVYEVKRFVQEINLRPFNYILSYLHELGIVDINPEKFALLRKERRRKIVGDLSNRSSMLEYSKIYSSTIEPDPILSVKISDFGNAVKTLYKFGLLATEGLFDLDPDIKFIEPIIRNLIQSYSQK